MKKFLLIAAVCSLAVSAMGAYQYEKKDNQGWLTFDSQTTVAFDLARSGKDKDHENFIDRGEGVADYGWYNLETGETGSFLDGASATFNENDRIGFYVKDNDGNVFTTTRKVRIPALGDDVTWGKINKSEDDITVYGGNKGSNGTHEYYIFKVSTANANGKSPSGQPLPGIIATLIIGGGAAVYLKKRKKLYASK